MKSYKIKHDFLFDADLDENINNLETSHKRLKQLKLSKLMSLRNKESLDKTIASCKNNKVFILDDVGVVANQTIQNYKALVINCFKQKFKKEGIPVKE